MATKYIRPTAYTSTVTGIAANATIAAGVALAASTALDNTTKRDTRVTIPVDLQFTAAPTANAVITPWLLKSTDGTDYEATDVNGVPVSVPLQPLALIADTSQHRYEIEAEGLEAAHYKLVLQNNDATQTATIKNAPNYMTYTMAAEDA